MKKSDIETVKSAIDLDFKGKHVPSIQRLLRQPSSSQEDLGIDKCVELLGRMYRQAGCDSVEIVETKGNPIVLGECRGESDKTLLMYFMYDTMPFREPGWIVPPMAAKMVKMRLPAGNVRAIINRGAYNTKGSLAAFLNSLKSCNDSVGRPPSSLILVAEGEEELGSPSLPAFVRRNRRRLSRANGCYFPYFGQGSDGSRRLNLGVKGVVYFELECSGKSWGRGPRQFPIHSSNKAWVDSPVWRLVDALSTMSTENGSKILIDGFYDDVAEPTIEEMEVIRSTAKSWDPGPEKNLLKISKFIVPEKDKVGLIKQFTSSTTLNIDGIWGGYTDKGSKTVLPEKATCKIDIRIVPNQKKNKMMPLVRRHLDRHGYGDIKMTEIDTGYDWCRCSYKAPIVQAMIRSYKAFVGEPQIWPNSGGSVPFYVFDRILRLPFTMGGIGHGDLAHSPNEYIVIYGNKRIPGLADVEKFYVHFMNEFAES